MGLQRVLVLHLRGAGILPASLKFQSGRDARAPKWITYQMSFQTNPRTLPYEAKIPQKCRQIQQLDVVS